MESFIESLIIAITFGVFWILITFFVKTTYGLKQVLFICSTVLVILASLYVSTLMELKKLKSSFTSTTIPTLSSITNGLYRIINSYDGPGGMNLVILHQEKVTSLDPIHKVLATTPVTPLPILVSLDSPLTSRNDTNQIYTGFVEVNTDQSGKKEIRDYFPFRHMK